MANVGLDYEPPFAARLGLPFFPSNGSAGRAATGVDTPLFLSYSFRAFMITFAYVDPGLGLLAWQALVAAFVGALFYIKKTRDFLVRLFQKVFRIGQRPEPALPVSTAVSPANDDGR